MKREVLQFDLITFDSSKVETTPQGFLKVPGRLTGVGVYPYLDSSKPGKIIRRLRSETEVFKPESMKTLENAPYTKRHPSQMITPENVGEFRKGHVCAPVVKEGTKYLRADVIIEDADAIADVKSGVKQLSCGYLATIDDTPGVWQDPDTGEKIPYDDQQIDITYNHAAGVPQGRQGPDKSLLLDRKEIFFQDGLDFDIPKGDGMKRELIIDGVKHEVEIQDDASFNAIHKAIGKVHEKHDQVNKDLRDAKTMCDDFKEKMEKAEEAKKEAKDALEKVTAQVDTLGKEVERLKKTHTDSVDPKNLVKLATARALKIAVLNNLTEGKKTTMEDSAEQTDAEIMKMVIIADASLDIPNDDKREGEIKKFADSLKDKSEVYLQAAYDAIERREKKTLQTNMDLGTFIIDTREIGARKIDQKDGLNPELRTSGRSSAAPKKKLHKDDDKGEGGNMEDKAYRDKQQGRYKDYRPAASKGSRDTKENKVR